jgi:hypothetical protein
VRRRVARVPPIVQMQSNFETKSIPCFSTGLKFRAINIRAIEAP